MERSRMGAWLIFVAALSVLCCSVGPDDPDENEPSDAPGLTRSDAVIRAKIQKKASSADKPTSPKQRLLERVRDRAGPDGRIRPDVLLAAKEHSDKMPVLDVPPPVTDAGGIWNWDWLGPGNIGGRIRAILIHPVNTGHIWIGSVSGGIWRSFDGGSSWQPVNDFLPSLTVTSLVMDPNDTQVLYASTGEGFGNFDALPGAGIFKSTDGGDTWSQLSSTTGWSWVNRLAHHPSQSDTLLAAVLGTGLGIYKTTDGGATWTQVLAGSTMRDVKFNPSFPSHAMAGSTGACWFSASNGDFGTWVNHATGGAGKIPNDGGRCEVALGALGYLWVSLDRNNGEVYRSTDAGATWTIRNTPTLVTPLGSQGWYDNAIWASPDDADLVVVAGIDAWRTNNGGFFWTRISNWTEYHTGSSAHADHHAIVEHPNYGTNNRSVYFGNDGGIQRANNIETVSQTTGWVNLANGLGITQFYGAASSPAGSTIIGGSQDNDTLRLLSGGGTGSWYQAETGDGGYCAVDSSDDSIMYSEYTNLQIQKSTDGGDTWVDSTGSGSGALTDAGDSNNARFIAPFTMDPNDSSVLVAGGSSIWYTSDGAANWTAIRSPQSGTPLCSAIDVAEGNSSRIWVGYANGTVSYTPVNILNWIDVHTNGSLPSAVVTDIAINPNNEQQVFVTFGGNRSNSVWYTSNNGGSWEQRTGSGTTSLPAIQVNTITFHPNDSDWVYVGTDMGIYASEDRGQTWNLTPRYGTHEGPVNTEIADLFWHNSSEGRMLVAATHGRGMYRTRPIRVVYVDAANTTGIEDGTSSDPYDTVQEGIDAAGNGTTLSIEVGDYNESDPTRFEKRMKVIATNGTVRIH